LAREERAYAHAEAERIAAYDRQQHDRLAMLDREDRQHARERNDLLALADHSARAAMLELELQHLRDAAAAAPPVQPVVNTLVAPSAPDISAQLVNINTPPAVTVAQLVDTSVPSTPLPAHARLDSPPSMTAPTAPLLSLPAYTARSALQYAADLHNTLPPLSGLPDTPVLVPRHTPLTSTPVLPLASITQPHVCTATQLPITSPKPVMQRMTAFYENVPKLADRPIRMQHYLPMTGTSHVPPMQTTPVFTTTAPRSTVLPPPAVTGLPQPPPPPLPATDTYLAPTSIHSLSIPYYFTPLPYSV